VYSVSWKAFIATKEKNLMRSFEGIFCLGIPPSL
jgi:hypothetical protein